MHPHSREELDNKWKIIQHMAFLSALTVVTITLRITSRMMQWGRLSTAEYLLLLSTVTSLAIGGCFVYGVNHVGLGHHARYVSDAQMVAFKKFHFAVILLIPTCLATAKVSLLWMLDRIFAHTMLRTMARILFAVVVTWWLTMILLRFLECRPIHSLWDGTCTSTLHPETYTFLLIPWIATDWLILIIPLPFLWKSVDTRRSRATQIGLVTLFSVGIVTCCISIKRYMTLQQVRKEDPTFSFTKAALWAMIECTTTICCAALPGSTYALKRMLPIDLMKRAISWVERKFDTFEPTRLSCRKLRADDMEANSAVSDQRNNGEPPNNSTNQVK